MKSDQLLFLVYAIGGIITYAVNVMDTLSGNASLLIKILLMLSIDSFLASIWPITWMLWIFKMLIGQRTPIDMFL